jgi:hypothetical protein
MKAETIKFIAKSPKELICAGQEPIFLSQKDEIR